MNGEGTLSKKESTYSGSFKNNLYHGKGVLRMTDGKRIECEWKDG